MPARWSHIANMNCLSFSEHPSTKIFQLFLQLVVEQVCQNYMKWYFEMLKNRSLVFLLFTKQLSYIKLFFNFLKWSTHFFLPKIIKMKNYDYEKWLYSPLSQFRWFCCTLRIHWQRRFRSIWCSKDVHPWARIVDPSTIRHIANNKSGRCANPCSSPSCIRHWKSTAAKQNNRSVHFIQKRRLIAYTLRCCD